MMKTYWLAGMSLLAALSLGVLSQQGVVAGRGAPETDPVRGNPNLTGEISVFTWSENQFQLAVAGFNKLYPKIKVKFNTVGYADAYPKLDEALKSKTPIADVVQIESEYVEQYAAAYPNAFTDLTNWAEKYSRDFDRAKWAQVNVKNKILAFPVDSAPVGFWYRADMFEKAGINAEDLDTWDQYVNAGSRVVAANPGVKLSYIDLNTETFLRTIVQQQGSFYVNNAGEIALDSAQVQQGMKILKRLWDGQMLLSVNGVGGVIGAMKAGKIAAVILPIWNAVLLKQYMPEMGGKWGVTTVPALGPGGGRAAAIGGSNLMIAQDSPNKDAAWAFVEYFSTQGMNDVLAKFGVWPSYLPLVKEGAFEANDGYFTTPNYLKPFIEVSKRMRVFRYSSDFQKTKNTVAAAQREVLTGGVRVDVALKNAAKSLAEQTGRLVAR
jgi:lactose/L-arabinose transport system substrate-binding protein